MPRYMIQSSHEPEECLKMLDAFVRAGVHYLTNTEWGCKDGVHTAWIALEAESDDDARLMVPPVIRRTALLVRLNRFTVDQIRELHQQPQVE